jgi:hypothetical protein
LHGEWAGSPATLCVPLTRAARYRSRASFFFLVLFFHLLRFILFYFIFPLSFFTLFLIYVLALLRKKTQEV